MEFTNLLVAILAIVFTGWCYALTVWLYRISVPPRPTDSEHRKDLWLMGTDDNETETNR